MKLKALAIVTVIVLACSGCNHSTEPKTNSPSALVANDSPAHAIERLIGAYERKDESAFAGMFTGDYTYEFSNSTDPTLVTQYSTGWFKGDETASSTHMFSGYTPPGGVKLEAASTIAIHLSVTAPTDDNSSGVDPATHKVLATPVDGQIVVPNPGAEATTFVITNNFNVFYIVRGDSAVDLDSDQAADSLHWYVYKWTDLTGGAAPSHAMRSATKISTWGRVKSLYR